MADYEGDLTPLEAWELLENHEDAVLVDVRTPQEWAETGIPDASQLRRPVVLDPLLPDPEAARELLAGLVAAGLTPGGDRPVLFVCRGGSRSARAAAIATAVGLTPAYNVAGGIEGPGGWRESGLPLAEWDGASIGTIAPASSPSGWTGATNDDPDQGSQERPDADEAGA
ncbi:rhodanese-related sulfurtransferase [Salana multivorans]|uniref:Rhodanese-related sulfurtransferase n=1 Tax=Salana multivorans TaxID=120377 RepID=A0A3N2D9X6_9MICO|nr:rhodanese-like domain-containing protein [Salana multivorans]MBN8882297.1 rhodanese-like domain-containing protein [Salana multivorans]OJX97390.1 MAG: hypothetical protein BGO96_05550 [Micrococcales bacterium 73-15]ROR96264.1 rhodanese-related sulfurtransferase [Salana multivorans]